MSDKEVPASIDDLLDRAVRAINLGDRKTADALAGQVLSVDGGNWDAEELLAAPGDSGEIRRLSILFADLVDSTALSTRIELEVYTDNVAGVALYTKYGFEIEGTCHRYAFRDGQYVDAHIMARIKRT